MDAATGMDSDPTQTVFGACQLNYDSLSFRFEGIVWSDFHDGSVGIPAFVREGQNVHIKATVDKYNPDSGFPHIDGFRVFPKAQDFRKNTEPIFPFHETFGRHVEYQPGNAPNHVISLADTGAIMAERKRPLQPYERIPDNAGARTSLYFPCLCIRERHIPL